MFHPLRLLPALALGALFLATQPASAQLYFDDFESYNLGSLDKNTPGGPNMAPNGSGNPWFGPEPGGPNLIVVGTENGVQPISGAQMVRGFAPTAVDFDQDWYNLAYRLNGGNPFTENVILSWWFYDPLGAGSTDYRDYVALGFYDTAPPNTDAPSNYDLNMGVAQIQRLSLGATTQMEAGFDPNFYQARVAGAADGYNAGGWFNTQTPRSVGWHQAAIFVAHRKHNGTNKVSFYIDDGLNPTLVHNSVTRFGYNVIELNASFGLRTAYYDDVGFFQGKKHEVARIFGLIP